jgi:L-ascorbate metabolism protein UlaG (beta-lactamase superfamily)
LDLHYHGHSCFELSDGDSTLLVDPFLSPNNPKADVTAVDVAPTHIALTHGHADHVADAVAVASRTGAEVVAVVELAKWLAAQGVETVHDPNLGGTVRFPWGSIKLVPAFHTNTAPGTGDDPFSPIDGTPIGMPAGLIIEFNGLTIYDAGDTCLFGDMELIGRRHQPDIAMLPIGGHYTMDREDAAFAADLIGAERVMPIHYDTFPVIETDVGAFARDIRSRGMTELVVNPGESVSLQA